jgi:peptide-methionine (S)-S-oxide reductase
MSIIFFHDEAQKKSAMESKARQGDKVRGKIYTEILPFSRFFLAEDYHQKYRLRSDKILMRDFNAIYPAAADFVNSTAAARINGYLGGYGTYERLVDELPGFGLSPAARDRLMEVVKRPNG